MTLGYSQDHRQQHRPGQLRILLAAAGAGLRSGQGQAAARRGRASRTASTPASSTATPPTPISARRWSTICWRSASAASCGRSSGPPSSRPMPTRSSRTVHAERRAARSATPRPGSRRSSSRAAPTSTAAIPTSTSCTRSRRTSSTARSARRSCDKMQQLVAREGDLRADLAARLHQRRRPAGRRVGVRADAGLSPTPRPTRTSRSKGRGLTSFAAGRQLRDAALERSETFRKVALRCAQGSPKQPQCGGVRWVRRPTAAVQRTAAPTKPI